MGGAFARFLAHAMLSYSGIVAPVGTNRQHIDGMIYIKLIITMKGETAVNINIDIDVHVHEDAHQSMRTRTAPASAAPTTAPCGCFGVCDDIAPVLTPVQR